VITTDRLSGSVLVLFALLVVWESRHLPLGTLRQPGPAYVPVVLALLLLLFGVLLVLTRQRPKPLTFLSWIEWRHAVAILAASCFAVFAIERLGYRLTMLLLLVFFLKFLENRGWILSCAYAVMLAFGSFFMFHTVLRVPLPLGPFGF
jgi:putative tricarboxylic transport membrane protein